MEPMLLRTLPCSAILGFRYNTDPLVWWPQSFKCPWSSNRSLILTSGFGCHYPASSLGTQRKPAARALHPGAAAATKSASHAANCLFEAFSLATLARAEPNSRIGRLLASIGKNELATPWQIGKITWHQRSPSLRGSRKNQTRAIMLKVRPAREVPANPVQRREQNKSDLFYGPAALNGLQQHHGVHMNWWCVCQRVTLGRAWPLQAAFATSESSRESSRLKCASRHGWQQSIPDTYLLCIRRVFSAADCLQMQGQHHAIVATSQANKRASLSSLRK